MARYGVERQELLESHECVSEEWWSADPSGWLRGHGNTIAARIGVVGRDGLDACVYD